MKNKTYDRVRRAINDGHTLPYEQYVTKRSLFWLQELASEADLKESLLVINERMEKIKKNEPHDQVSVETELAIQDAMNHNPFSETLREESPNKTN